jgi:hypothetical protein
MRIGALLLCLLALSPVGADSIFPGEDGWHSWRVPTHNVDREICCAEWNSGRSEPAICHLDDRRGGFNVSKRAGQSGGEMQVYALMEDGIPVKVRTLSPDCPVRTTSDIQHLGLIDSETSFEWLRKFASPRSDVSADALTAIAMHEGSGPRGELLRVALHDEDQENREAAVFAISQLAVEEAVDTLIDVIEQRGLDLDTRRSALFWLAQSDSSRVVDYFSELLAAK